MAVEKLVNGREERQAEQLASTVAERDAAWLELADTKEELIQTNKQLLEVWIISAFVFVLVHIIGFKLQNIF